MKLFIKRQTNGVTVYDPNVANGIVTPGTVVRNLIHHPLYDQLLPPVMANYTGLGASGGVFTGAGKQAGIKIARNGSWIPYTIEYYRITCAARCVANLAGAEPEVGQFASISGDPDNTFRLKGEAFPNSVQTTYNAPPANQGRIYAAQEKLNYTNNNSQVVQSSIGDIQNQDIWPLMSSSNGYPGTNSNTRAIPALEPTYNPPTEWDMTAFNAGVAAFGAGTTVKAQASVCEYYVINIDDTLISNISSLLNDVFIIIPHVIGKNKMTNVGGGLAPIYADSGIATGIPLEANLCLAEMVLPLSWVQSQIAIQRTPIKGTGGLVVGNATPVIFPVYPPVAGAYFDLDTTCNGIVTTTPQNEIAIIDPPPPPWLGTNGPY